MMPEKICLKCGGKDFTVTPKEDSFCNYNSFKCDKCGATHRFSPLFGDWVRYVS
jgi:hypothetical protein